MTAKERYNKETGLKPTEDIYGNSDQDYIGNFYTEDYVDWLETKYPNHIAEQAVGEVRKKYNSFSKINDDFDEILSRIKIPKRGMMTAKPDAREIAYFAVRGTDRDPVKDVEVVKKMIEEYTDQKEREIIEFLKEKDPFKNEKDPHDGKAGYWYAIHNLMFRKK